VADLACFGVLPADGGDAGSKAFEVYRRKTVLEAKHEEGGLKRKQSSLAHGRGERLIKAQILKEEKAESLRYHSRSRWCGCMEV